MAGRTWVLDRETSPDKLKKTISALTTTDKTQIANSSIEAVKAAYKKKIYDYSFPPTILMKVDPEKTRIESEDIVIFFDFEGKNLNGLVEKISHKTKLLYSLTDYNNVKVQPIYDDIEIKNSLSEVLSENNKKHSY